MYIKNYKTLILFSTFLKENTVMATFNLGVDIATIQDVVDICFGKKSIRLSDQARERVLQSSKHVSKIVESGEVVYGVNTGFGPLCSTLISKEKPTLC